MTSQKLTPHENVVWHAKPWIVPAVVLRTVIVFIVTILFIILETFTGVVSHVFFGLPIWAWTTLIFIIVWLISISEMLIFRLSNTYVLRQDGLETRRGIIRLRSFVVTPSGFGDLLVYQSIGGRIFGYGEITVNSQGERQTKLVLVAHHSKQLTQFETLWASQQFESKIQPKTFYCDLFTLKTGNLMFVNH